MTKTVYYLDDEVELCDVFSSFLNSQKISVKTFTNANEAIDYCNKFPPDLFLIDYRLTDTTGNIVANKISKDIRKILITGDLSVPEQDGFDEIICKPYSLTNMRTLIMKYIEDYKPL